MRWMIILLSVCCGCKSPKKIKVESFLPLEYETSRYNTKCKFTNQFSLEKRLSNEPFRSAKRVDLVSYDGGVRVEPLQNEIRENNEGLIGNPFPQINARYLGIEFYEAFSLTENQVDGLTNILFNYAYWKDEKDVVKFVGPSCYSPQHMILFYREPTDREPFAWIEICLLCVKYKTFPDSIDLGVFCESKYDLLREFFRQVGIKHGLEGY